MSEINWMSLKPLHEKAIWRGVSYSLTYEEASDTWSCEISSAAPGECFAVDSVTFDYAVRSAVEWLDGLSGQVSP